MNVLFPDFYFFGFVLQHFKLCNRLFGVAAFPLFKIKFIISSFKWTDQVFILHRSFFPITTLFKQ